MPAPLQVGHDDAGEIVASEDFPYHLIDGEEEQPTAQDLAAAAMAMQKVMEWVWQGGPRNHNGFEIRSVIACWIFLKHLHALNLTQVAAMMNKDKQSLGRWVDDFKKEFPAVKTEHMRV